MIQKIDKMKKRYGGLQSYDYNILAEKLNEIIYVLNSLTEEKVVLGVDFAKGDHSSVTTHEEKEKLQQTETNRQNQEKQKLDDMCNKPQEEKGESWEKEFDEKYCRKCRNPKSTQFNKPIDTWFFPEEVTPFEIKSFISSLLSTTAEKARAEERERILETIDKMELHDVDDYYLIRSAITKN